MTNEYEMSVLENAVDNTPLKHYALILPHCGENEHDHL